MAGAGFRHQADGGLPGAVSRQTANCACAARAMSSVIGTTKRPARCCSMPRATCAQATSQPYSRDGAFRIVDRKKDILITSGGKNIAPAAVENALRCSPYISEVIVFGDQRKYVTRPDRDRFRECRAMGAPASNSIYRLHEPFAERKGRSADRRGSPGAQSAFGARRAGQEIPDSAEGARAGGRRYDADAKSQTGARLQAVRRYGRRHVCRG